MNDWVCDKCLKKFPYKDLTELFGWGVYVCTPCIEEWLDIEDDK